jgi:hypothetical protein
MGKRLEVKLAMKTDLRDAVIGHKYLELTSK